MKICFALDCDYYIIMVSQDDKCAYCGDGFRGKSHVSSLYGSNGVLLCKSCGNAEERAIEEEGTNDVPWLLRQYRLFMLVKR